MEPKVGRRVRTHLVVVLVCGALAAAGAASAADVRGSAGRDAAGQAAAANAVNYVVAISVDAFNPDALDALGPSRAPNFHRMIDEGASTLNARTVWSNASTLPNHISMITGREVKDFDPYHGHGVKLNNYQTTTVRDIAGERVDSVFSVVHDAGGRTALYSPKPKFDLIDRSWNQTHGARDRVGADNGRDKIDVFMRDDEATMVADLRQRLKNRPPAFSFFHMGLPDKVGHQSGFMSEPYLTAVADVDAMLGRVFNRITRNDDLAGHTTVVVMGDHGGLGEKHTAPSEVANYTVPFLAWGAGVANGEDLYALNDDRRDPGLGRPKYNVVQPVRNADVANLATDLLDLPPIAHSQMNKPQTLDVR